jgi:hypothetical protein
MRAMRTRFVALLVAACGGTDPLGPDAATPDAPEGPSGCPRSAAPADRARHVVVSHPYDAAGMPAGTFEVLELSTAGELSRPGRTFTLGRAVFGTIAFTPDGEVGLAALDNGTLGVFRLDPDGMPSVVHAGFSGTFYASRVVVDPRGDRALVIDGNTRGNGGGIYLVTIDCDGALTEHGPVVLANTPGGIAFAAGDRAIVAGPTEDAPPGDDLTLVRWSERPERVSSVDAFGDELAIVGGAALTHDRATYLVGDTSQFSGVPNRVAVVTVAGDTLTARQTLDVEDPQAIATSPFGDVAVVASAFGDALFVLDAGGPGGAWRVRGEVAYRGGRPQLPGDVAAIERGALRGHVFVSENVSVRHLAFGADGTVTDLGSLAFGSGLANIGGAIGVTP